MESELIQHKEKPEPHQDPTETLVGPNGAFKQGTPREGAAVSSRVRAEKDT